MAVSVSQEIADSLVNAPSEGLNVEIKRWIDPTHPTGIAKIAVACMALRNRDGGYLVVGLDDGTLQPVKENRPDDVRSLFHLDVIQQIVSKYASMPFEVAVAFGRRDGLDFPVIAVGSGVRSPVAATKELAVDGKPLIRQHAVYFRTLNASGVPSSSPARYSDWPDIVDICFENREADIGRFLRRHLGVDGSTAFNALLQTKAAPPNLRDKTLESLERNQNRLIEALDERGKANLQTEKGSWSVLLKFDPPLPDDSSAKEFLRTIASANPQYTGWPVWLDSSNFHKHEDRPVLIKKVWESVIIDIGENWANHADFYRFDRRGELYLWRVLQDDISDKVEPGRYLDPGLMVYRVLEALAVGLAFAKAFGRSEETTLAFAFRWSNLQSRELDSWANRDRYFSSHGKAMGNEAEGYVDLSADTPAEALAPYAQVATQHLFELWDGWTYPLKAIEQQLERLLKRNL
ncbi:AlbA family DNA-binding domain-containing protein [Agrobacterium tumefaciens]|uniref:AlbA family DNA-binding domain-containing protein n=1 Tax=Agrobacterium tumefaciens TaxID=358 RepID=UPI002244DAFB|nr:ATP-binding protein [Agrobacterium tumefaciens]MCW8057895.1 ATP-binding protein [Agrobacterium tumefaciens]MCW8143776.1 ATP-binding protein [Agrobacterium tumefaciens]